MSEKRKNQVIVFNSHGVGQYAYTDKLPVWGETLPVHSWHIAEDGGKGSNVAVALGRLGVRTAYIGKVGNDPWGDLGEKWMGDAGVDTRFLYRTDEVATGTGLILISPEGKNTIIDGDSSAEKLTEAEVLEAIDALSESDYLITGFEVPRHLSLKASQYAHDKGIKVALNPSPLQDINFDDLSFVDYLFINEVEGEVLLGREETTEVDDYEIIKEVSKKYKAANIIMTIGERGVIAYSEGEFITLPAVKVTNIKNTAGAGDGFMAATVAGLSNGKSLEEALDWARYFAALSITIDGTIPAYRPVAEVEEFIKKCDK